MNFVDQFLALLRAPASSPGQNWLDWFGALSRGWSAAQAPPPTAPPPQATGKQTATTEQISVQELTALLDRYIVKK